MMHGPRNIKDIKEYGTTIRSVSGEHVCTLFPAFPLASGRGSTINFNVSCC